MANENNSLIIKDGVVTSCNKDVVNVVIPAGVTEIHSRAFYDCVTLESVVIPESIKKIGYLAFKHCTSIESVEFGGTKTQWEAVEGKIDLLYFIPAKVVKCSDGEWQKPVLIVEDGFLEVCLDKKATSVVIPEGVTEIGEYAFCNCASLEAVVIPPSVTVIGKGAFDSCKSLLSVKIPMGVKIIGYEAFRDCALLKSMEIPESVEFIDYDAFKGCKALAEVVFYGTMEQWKAMPRFKFETWREDVPAKVVKCSDGEVAL